MKIDKDTNNTANMVKVKHSKLSGLKFNTKVGEFVTKTVWLKNNYEKIYKGNHKYPMHKAYIVNFIFENNKIPSFKLSGNTVRLLKQGKLNLDDMLSYRVNHCQHNAAFMNAKRIYQKLVKFEAANAI